MEQERMYTLDELYGVIANLDNRTSEPCEKSMKRVKIPIPKEYGGGWAAERRSFLENLLISTATRSLRTYRHLRNAGKSGFRSKWGKTSRPARLQITNGRHGSG